MVDILASEYGWPVEQIMDLPTDQAAQLIHAILHRKGVKTRRVRYELAEEAASLPERLEAIWGKIDTE